MSSTEIQQTWEKYIAEDKLEHSKLNPTIIDSWKLSKKHNVNPYAGVGNRLLATTEFQEKLKDHETMITLAKRNLDRLAVLFKNIDFILVLTDADGFILWRSGNATLKENAREIGFHEGCQWTEAIVGTNAIGVALRTKTANMIHSYEHFAKASQQWSCASSPIFGENQEVIGAIDLSMPAHYPKKIDFLITVQLIADNISEVLKRKTYEEQKYMLHYFFNKKHSGILCNSSMTILYISPELMEEPEFYIGKKLKDLSKDECTILQQESIWKDGVCIGYFVHGLKPKEKKTFTFRFVCGHSNTFHELLEEVKIVAPTNASIHLYGETGTGKEILAKTIHENSPFSTGKLVSVNCGAIPENLMESELFGYDKGAFTGANAAGYQGKIEQAHNGTLFLDEIEDMPLSMQSNLLRVLQEKKLTRIGGSKEIEVNFRLITASNKDLKTLVMDGEFREDLFYRVYVCPLYIPPLRERKEDIQALIQSFEATNSWYPSWEKDLIQVAESYQWQGNIRELNNFLERCFVYYKDRVPTRNDLERLIHRGGLMPIETSTKGKFKEQLEKETIMNSLIQHNGNIPLAAKQLDMSKSTLYRKMNKYKLN